MARLPSRTALFDAAKFWDVTKVKDILSAAPALAKARDPQGRMAVHIACAAKPGTGQCEPHGIKVDVARYAQGWREGKYEADQRRSQSHD